ncbi:efflux RND transporter periplasmic adaptor subunit [Peptoniphilaceae bacterium SGI.131]
MSKGKKNALIVLFILIVGIAVFLLWKNKSSNKNENVAFVSSVEEITGGGLLLSDRFSGVVEAQKAIDINKIADKKVAELFVKAGDQVKAKSQLFRYDVSEAQKEIDTINLDIEEQNAIIAAKEKEIADLQSQLETASENNRLDIQTSISEAQNAVRQAQYEIQYKQISIADKQKEIDNAIVLAPAAGTIKAINENQTSENGQTLPYIQISQSGDFVVRGKVDESSIQSMKVGQKMLVRSRKDETKTWTGKISEIKLEPDNSQNRDMPIGQNASGESQSKYPFYVALDSSKGLMLGQHVFIEIASESTVVKDGIWLDASYIVMEEEKAYIWMADANNKLKKQAVELGQFDEAMNLYEIKSGLEKTSLIAWPMENYKEGMATQSMKNVERGE